jgi:nucleoside-diphosphate-sugar epimerase
MTRVTEDRSIIGHDDLILLTGSSGYIGLNVLKCLLDLGYRRIRCLARPSGNLDALRAVANAFSNAHVEILTGNLLSREICVAAAKDVAVIYHLAAGTGQKSFADAFMNSVVTTRNLLEACSANGFLKRFVNVSSLAVYSNEPQATRQRINEECPIERHPESRGEAYCFAKVKQEEFVREFCEKSRIPYVIVRPGVVYGPGKAFVPDRVGIDTFGIFLHIGGSNRIPLTYVENCAEAIVLCGLKDGIDGEVFNVIDDDLPSSRQFLRSYKQNVKRFRSLWIPHWMSYSLCYLWERYSRYSFEQLPPSFNRKRWNAYWRRTEYSNRKLKQRVGWSPRVPSVEGLSRFFKACRSAQTHA